MRTPSARGALSSAIIDCLEGRPVEAGLIGREAERVARTTDDVLRDDDMQISLFTLYELFYGGFEGVDDAFEWDGELLAARARLEDAVEARLRADVVVPDVDRADAEGVAQALFALTSADDGPSVSRFIAREATREQADEFLMHRSIYQLKEADPHTWAIPRLKARPKAALIEIQADEYGGGRVELMHAELFARTMRAAGLDDTYGGYVDRVPAITLASLNMMSMFGLHRRLRGAICGHLAAFEMTSSIPNRFYGNGFRRLGFGPDATGYFDEHVEADAVHEQIAGRDLAGGLAEQQPKLLPDILFGAAACLHVDGLVGAHLIESWTAGETSLVGAR